MSEKEPYTIQGKQLYAYVMIGNNEAYDACGKEFNPAILPPVDNLKITHDLKTILEVMERNQIGRAWLFPQMTEINKAEVSIS